MKVIKNICQLVGNCDGQGGDVRWLWGGVTFVRKCSSSMEGVTRIRKVCQFLEKCDGQI